MSDSAPRRRSSKGKQRPARDGATIQRPAGARGAQAAAAQEAERQRRLRLLAGGALVAIIVVVALIAFTVLNDDDASDEAVVIPPGAAEGSPAAGGASPEATSAAGSASPEASPTGAVASATGTVGHLLGDPNAPLTIVEYADFQCPFCGEFAREIKPQLIADYVDTGKVQLEFRDLAFLGQESLDAAEASWCAGDQGKYWEFHDTLFANQSGENEGAFARARLVEMATGIGLDVTTFESCIDGDTHEASVQASNEQAAADGVTSTPTLIIDGEKLVGLGSYDELRDRIEEALGNQ